MKKKIFPLILAFAGLLLVSCNSYLETKTYGQKLPENIDDYEQLLASQLRSFDNDNDQYYYGPRNILKYECYSDNLNASLATAASSAFTPAYVGSDIEANQYRMQKGYAVLKDLNIILGQMPDQESEKGRKIIATCHAMRGALYFQMMRELCEAYDKDAAGQQLGLPLVDQFNIDARPARASLQATIDFIVKDLQTAIDMDIEDDTYRFNSEVAKAFLARTYFWAEDWDNAIRQAKPLLEKHPLLSATDFKKMIQASQEKIGNTLLISYISGSKNGYSTIMKKSKERPVDPGFVKLFVEKRRDIRYTNYFDKNLLNTKSIAMRVRSAEFALILAEAYAHKGEISEALKYLNELRSKRISSYQPITETTLPAVDATALVKADCTGRDLTPLLQAILNERRKELYMEGDRWFELKRNGGPVFWVGYNGMKYITHHYLYTYPLSFRDMHTNPALVQNEVYPSPRTKE